MCVQLSKSCSLCSAPIEFCLIQSVASLLLGRLPVALLLWLLLVDFEPLGLCRLGLPHRGLGFFMPTVRLVDILHH